MRLLTRLLGFGLAFASFAVIVGAAGLWLLYARFADELPDYAQLADYEPPIASRIYAADGRFLAEYARERRIFVPIGAVPEQVKNAFIAAEDQNFHHHFGIDPRAVVAAAVDNVRRFRDNRRPRGASTITQQVAKNFFLTNEVTLERKIMEALLAIRIERAFTKDQILELYLNEIFLGARSYGVAAAALSYFGKGLDELTLSETAFLAGLPQAPSLFDPRINPERATARRNYVLDRMLADGFIAAEEAAAARAEPIVVTGRDRTQFARASYFADEVRRRLEAMYGAETLFEAGLVVRTTVDNRVQAITDEALRNGLFAFDRNNGFRGAVRQLEGFEDDWLEALRRAPKPVELGGSWGFAVILSFDGTDATIGLDDGTTATLRGSDIAWARPLGADGRRGPQPNAVRDILDEGDMILIARTESGAIGLRHIPDVNGAVVALDPNTGRVLALSGGFDFRASNFNRATQALRQPGSAFKPFVYLAALEHGFTPQTVIDDAPISLPQGPGLPMWEPRNYAGGFMGPSSMRRGLERSSNLMTVRIAQTVGMDSVMEVAQRFGIERGLTPFLAAALGSNEVDLLSLTAAYGAFANGGKRITPHVIDRIQDRHGRTLYVTDPRACPGCAQDTFGGSLPPVLPDHREQIADSRHTFQLVSMLQGAIERGTATRARALGRPLAGKTGTTNEARDVWFVGFSPDLVMGVYVGHDQPRSLGRGVTGGSTALPIWVDAMGTALEDVPIRPFRVPPGLRLVAVNTGEGRILEAFVAGTEPGSGYRFSAATLGTVTVETPAVERGTSIGVGAGGLY
ncbi:MAG: penicillin-binding protein 1A [Geminicoccaceae bacterium]|nr:MAG: penicillin-binding protein 1A [Geminicoccaceae bacterium]